MLLHGVANCYTIKGCRVVLMLKDLSLQTDCLTATNEVRIGSTRIVTSEPPLSPTEKSFSCIQQA